MMTKNVYTKEVQQIPSTSNKKKTTPRHIIIKLFKTIDNIWK